MRQSSRFIRRPFGIIVLLAAQAAAASCGWGVVKPVDYSVRPMAVLPLGARAIDRSQAFAETFCATLPHTGDWGACGQYLETQVTPPPPVSTPIATGLKVMLVGGAFSECFENKKLHLFAPSVTHLKDDHQVLFGPPLSVGGTSTPEDNAGIIAKYLEANPGEYIAIGHSKGAVDLMTAVQTKDVARSRIKALVSVAGAIAGSRLADLGVPLGILGFRDAVYRSGLGHCDIVDHGGIGSLKRNVRYEALRHWNPPATLRTYSVVAVSAQEKTSAPLQTMWRRNAHFSIDQDSHILAEEQIIPGSEVLGIARADHWAIALPMSEHPLTKDKVDHNRFPRTALLEAIVRFVAASQTGRGPAEAGW